MKISEMQEKFLKEQNELKSRINIKDTFDTDKIKLIAGVDLAY